jgi:hypothetical protein
MKLYIKMDNVKHGQEVPGKLGRWCEKHKIIHGRFYVCEEYPLEIKRAIVKEERSWKSASASYALMFFLFVLLLALGLR